MSKVSPDQLLVRKVCFGPVLWPNMHNFTGRVFHQQRLIYRSPASHRQSTDQDGSTPDNIPRSRIYHPIYRPILRYTCVNKNPLPTQRGSHHKSDSE